MELLQLHYGACWFVHLQGILLAILGSYDASCGGSRLAKKYREIELKNTDFGQGCKNRLANV